VRRGVTYDAAVFEDKWSLDCGDHLGKQSGLAHSHITCAQRSAYEPLILNVGRNWNGSRGKLCPLASRASRRVDDILSLSDLDL